MASPISMVRWDTCKAPAPDFLLFLLLLSGGRSAGRYRRWPPAPTTPDPKTCSTWRREEDNPPTLLVLTEDPGWVSPLERMAPPQAAIRWRSCMVESLSMAQESSRSLSMAQESSASVGAQRHVRGGGGGFFFQEPKPTTNTQNTTNRTPYIKNDAIHPGAMQYGHTWGVGW